MIKTPMKAIRAKCLDCCCGNQNEVRTCKLEKCSLYPYRFGCRPSTIQKRAEKVKKHIATRGF